ncbi:RDD domain containing protein [Rippkaea orientalis PCC 8801]|uniref:RDD domain containing protein n=1 Tax=Rippkaea orientalis (strain PCC 8801 / RF-1) TaxID=41431 RepID=B7K488_RIPO1|nr:RDD family protein [Rippkaea orientalis]ACK67794.1 RDD domain containing protein [Rippkaea orientalis PCC 8801]
MYSDDYSSNESAIYQRFPKVPLDRRAYAFLLDFLSVWFVSSFFTGLLKEFVFIILWSIARIIIVEKNKGQSLGSWAFDMKVIDPQFTKIPGLKELGKREGILGSAALLAMVGLSINFRNALSMILFITPLLIDCGMAVGDPDLNRAFHDRIAGTIVIQSRRGFSLDLRLKKLWFIIQDKLKSRQNKDDWYD